MINLELFKTDHSTYVLTEQRKRRRRKKGLGVAAKHRQKMLLKRGLMAVVKGLYEVHSLFNDII